MVEVNRVKGGQDIKIMNKEVLQVVLPDYMMYMERSARGSGRSVMSDMDSGPASGPASGAIAGEIEDRQDIDTAFSKMQASRQGTARKPLPPQDFRISLDDGPVPMDVFERIKQDRDAEARRAATAAASTGGQGAFAEATGNYAMSKRRADEEAEAAFAEEERKKLEARAAASAANQAELPMPPDMRQLFLGDRQGLSRTLNQSAGNPTLALGGGDREEGGGRQQMIITREPATMAYKENELNLFVYSGDRDWSSTSAPTTETRYNFSVSFDPGNMPTGLRISPTSTVKFRNIVRIELVKAIMPAESLDSLVSRTYSSGFTYSSAYNFNVLAFPYIQLRIPELDNNIYGTNLGLNAAFGVLQYDANWIYDTNNPTARGYLAMIPKFLKCQKTYQPTPLATLQKLSFRFERPDGSLVSTVPDTLDISCIRSSKEVAAAAAFPYGFDTTQENTTSAAYYFIYTKSYFNNLTVSKGDRIIINNLAWATGPSGAAIAQLQGFLSFIQGSAGFIVVDTGYGTQPSAGSAVANTAVTFGSGNTQGYCNVIVVRGNYSDPTLGTTTTVNLGSVADSSNPGVGAGNTVLTPYLFNNNCSTGRLLNASHQVQIALRVITREMDSTSILRPDNL